MELTGAQIVIECLKEQGVDTVFGYPGGAILNVYDELYKHQEIRHILTSHEQGASHAADGYARSTGKVGVCFATSGPGATNLVTGIATAYMDSVPIVAITCNVNVPLLGKDSFQEIDIAGITTPITKHNFIVKDVTKLAVTIRRAFRIAQKGRPGPVLVDIPKDITAAKTEYEFCKAEPIARVTDTIREEDLAKALAMIKAAEKPYIFVGGGAVISGASAELKEFVHKVDAPVCDSLMGKGAFDGTNDLYTGMLGMHGNYGPNIKNKDCDLIIAIGMRFDDRVTGNPERFGINAKVIHFEIDPSEINKIIYADVPVVGDVKRTLPLLTALVHENDHSAWIDEFRACYDVECEKIINRVTRPSSGPLRMGEVVDRVSCATRGDAVLVTDVGQHQMMAARYFKFNRPRSIITSGGLGTMGFGLPAAIGAKLAVPEREVCLFVGDGGFQMNIQELATVFQTGAAVKVILLNNGYLGMVRQWQELFFNHRYSFTQMLSPDFGLIAKANGIEYSLVEQRGELDDAVSRMLMHKGPYVMEVRVENEENVFPMVPAGAELSQIMLE